MKKIADKTLSFGCKIKNPYKDEIAYISKGYWYSNNGGDRIPFLELIKKLGTKK